MNTRTEEFQTAAYDLIYLASCAVNGIVPDQARVGQMDLDQLYQAADYHMMTAIAAMALESAGVKTEAFTQAKGKAIRKAILLDAERMALQEKLEEAGIWYMPLKGAILKDLYPKIGMRQMSDVDILVDGDRMEEVQAVMGSLGYTIEVSGLVHESFHKPPVSRIEVHSSLFDSDKYTQLNDFYAEIKESLLKDDDNQFGYHFSDEAFYVYLIAHEYKHYISGGIGLRALLDTYVFCKSKKDTLDQASIEADLDRLGIADFEKKNRKLSFHLFDGDSIDTDEKEMMDYMLSSGIFGTLEKSIDQQVEQYGGGVLGRIRYTFRRVFPPMKTVRKYYPAFAKFPVLLPLLPFYLLLRGLTVKKGRMKAEIRALLKK